MKTNNFLPPATAEVRKLFADTASEMVRLFGISRAEAVARINGQWHGQQFLGENEVVLHEDPYYWALFIYYGTVPDWSPNADRSSWRPVPLPPKSSPAWTLTPARRQKHCVVYVPGIRDDMWHVQSLLLQVWRLWGVRPLLFAMPWAGEEAYEPKFARLLALIDDAQKEYAVSLVGASAGASAVLNAYAKHKRQVQSVAYVCGKINRPNAVSPQTYARNPAYKVSLRELQGTIRLLGKSDRSKLCSFYSPADTTVPHEDTVIKGVAEHSLPAVTHMWAILYALSFGSHAIVRELRRCAGR